MNEILGSGTGFVLVGAGLTLAGVVAGWLMSTVSSRAGTRPKRSEAAAAEVRQLALRTVIALDEFVGACRAAVNDRPEFNPSDPTEFVFHVEDPRLVLPRDAEWSIMRPDVVEQLLWMSSRIRNVLDALDSLNIVPPAFDDLFERREKDFSRLGLRALDLIQTISAEYDLPIPERPTYYDPRCEFQNRIQTIADARSRRRRRCYLAQLISGLRTKAVAYVIIMIFFFGSCPRRKAGSATEQQIVFK